MADYGTVVMTTLLHAPALSRSAADISIAIRVPAPTVSKILKMLARAGLLVSSRGAKGGYLLSRPADKISLAEIIYAMDGPIGMTECSVTPGLCAQETACAVRANWQRVNQAVLSVLQGITLDQMIAPVVQHTNTAPVTLTRMAQHAAVASSSTN